MSRINLTIDSRQYHDIPATSTSLNLSIDWKAAPGKVKWSVAWSEHLQWIALQFLSATRMTLKTLVENASDEVVMGGVRAVSEFTQLFRQQNHLDPSLKALDDALKPLYKKKGIFWEKKMLMSAQAWVNDLLPRESHHLREQKIHNASAAMEALVYGAEKVSTSKCRQFHVHLNRVRQAATTWSDADRQKAMERLESEVQQMTPAKWRLFNKLFQWYKRQLLKEVGTKGTGPRSKSAKELAVMNFADEDTA